MTSREALEELEVVLLTNPGTKRYADIFTKNLLETITEDLEVLEKLEAKTHLLFKYRKAIAKEFDKWCEENNVVNCSESMATWFLSIKLKEWLENDK